MTPIRREAPGLGLGQRIGPGRIGIVRRNLCNFLCIGHHTVRDIEPEFHSICLRVVSDEAMDDLYRLRLHSSTRDPPSYLPAGQAVEFSGMFARLTTQAG